MIQRQKTTCIILLSLIMVIWFSSCSTESRNSSSQFTIPHKDTVTFRQKSFSLSLPSCVEDSTNCASVSIRWVEAVSPYPDHETQLPYAQLLPFVNSSISKAVIENLRWDVSTVQDTDTATMESLSRAFLNDYLRDRSASDTTDPVSWNCSVDVSIEHNTEHFITVRSSSYIYTGGAHPLQTTTYYVIATHKPRLLTLHDIVVDTATLRTVAEIELRRMYDIPLYHDLRNHGFTLSSNSVPLSKNFAFTRTGLTLVYNPYDISPYSMGMHTIQLPYSAIAPLLRRDISAIMQ